MKLFGILKSTCLMRMLLRLTGNCVTENGIIPSSNRNPWKKIKTFRRPKSVTRMVPKKLSPISLTDLELSGSTRSFE